MERSDVLPEASAPKGNLSSGLNVNARVQRFTRRRRRRGSRKPMRALIPNILTLSGMCCGLTGIHMALEGHGSAAIVAVLMGAFFDGIDGRTARRLGVASRFGAELDSLADSAAFGIAPAVIVYVSSLCVLGKIGWVISLLFAMCMALRLARFNTHDIEQSDPVWRKGLATGVPAPAGAYMLLFPMMAERLLGFHVPALFYAGWTLLSSGLLVSRLPTPLLKGKKGVTLSPQKSIGISLGVVVFLGLLYSFPWAVLFVIGLGYLILIPFVAHKAYQNKARLESNCEVKPSGSDANPASHESGKR